MEVPVEITNEDLKSIAVKLPKSFGSAKSYNIVPLSINPVGFWGDHLILKIYNHKSDSYEFFLKAVPRHIEKRLEIIQETGFFEREVKIYEHFIPRLLELSSVCWAPKIYLVKENHFIVLENLKNFSLYPSKIGVWDRNHFEIAVKTLGIFHASSVIYEEKFGKITDDELKLLEELAYPQQKDHIRNKGVENGIKTLIELTKLIPKYKNSSKIDNIVDAIPETIRKIFEFVKTSKKYRNVLLHGDIWVNNVMFRYDENYVPVECKYIDFQFSRFAPQAMDLATFFYASATSDFRKQHLDALLDMYCKTFEEELDRHRIPHSVLPRNEILKSFDEFRIAGLVESAIFNHVTLLPSDIASDMMNSSEEYEKFFRECRKQKCIKAFLEEDYYRDRMTEILCELIDDFILPKLKF